MVPTIGASGASNGTTCVPSTGRPSSPACGPPSARWPPPAANATKAPFSKGPGDRALFYLDDDAIGFAVAAQDVHGAEALQVQPVEAAAQLLVLLSDDGGADGAVTRRVPREAELERQGEDDGDRRSAVPAGRARWLRTS